MSLHDALAGVLKCPTPAGLWALRAEMLEARIAPDARAWPVVGRYHEFLDQMAGCLSSRHYSDLASKLDIGSITGVVLERLLEPQGARELALSLLSGALSEGLMVLATRQHVKAWEQGMAGFVRSAAWFLYDELWRWSEGLKPDLAPAGRRRLLDQLFAPVRDDACSCYAKAVVLGTLFQLLLISHLAARLQEE